MRFIIAVCLGLLGLAGPVAALEPRAGETLRILVATDEPKEMFSFTPGPSPGMTREMLEGFTRLHKMKLEVVPVKVWDDIIPALNRGDGDLIVGIIATDARRKLVDFTVETLPSRHLAVSRKPAPPIATVEELKKARVAVIGGSSWADVAIATGVPAARLDNHADTAGVVAALKSGKTGAAVMSLSDFLFAVRKDPALQGGVFVGPVGSSAWALRKQDTQLKRALDEYIENQRKSAAWSRLIVKYFGEDALAVLGRARN